MYTVQLLLIAVNFLLSIVSFLLKRPRDRFVLNPVNSWWAGFVYFSVIQPLFALELYTHRYGDTAVSVALFMFSVSASVMILVEHLPIRITNKFQPKHQYDFATRLEYTGIVLTMIGIGAFALLVSKYGGITVFFLRDELRKIAIDGSQYFIAAPEILFYGITIGLLSSAYKRNIPLILVFSLLLAVSVVWFIYMGSRSRLLLAATTIAGLIYASRMRNPSLLSLLAFSSMLFFLVGFVGYYRTGFNSFALNLGSASVSEVIGNSFDFMVLGEQRGYIATNEDFGMAAAVVSHVPEDVDFNYGLMFSQMFVQWIPRTIWTGKFYPEGIAWHNFHLAAGTSDWINDAGLLSGPAPTAIGKYWYCLGPLGVILGTFLSGLFLRFVWIYALTLPTLTRTIVITLVAGFGFSEINNPVYWLTFWLPTGGVALFIVLILASRQKQKRRFSMYGSQ